MAIYFSTVKDAETSTSIGGAQSRNAPSSGASPGELPSAKKLDQPDPKKVGPRSTNSALSPSAVVKRLKTASLPPVSPVSPVTFQGALLGLLFGQMLDRQGQVGASRDAAIGAAAFASAEQELAERLQRIQLPGVFPAIVGEMPVAPAPIRRPGILTT